MASQCLYSLMQLKFHLIHRYVRTDTEKREQVDIRVWQTLIHTVFQM